MLPAVERDDDCDQARRRVILAVVRAIPAGQVAGYGEVARRAGLPGRARLVARLLARSAQSDLPWHRVLRSDGRIAFAPGSPGFVEQLRRLRAEGLVVSDSGRVMTGGAPDLDSLLWKPAD